jgi:KUP system potassium uptake protein
MIKFKNSYQYLQPLGIVFGDIGTSPIYTLSTIAIILKQKDPTLIMGAVSLVIWLLILVVYIQYVLILMNLSTKGEGGQLILREYVLSLVKNNPFLRFLVSFLGLFGFAAVVSEGILTPAISILSAVEGIKLINPSFNNNILIILISIFITIWLFSIQRRGTEKVSSLFTPIMIIWFIFLFIIGTIYIYKYPGIINAINPVYIIELLKRDPMDFLLIISFSMLSITGVEGMYSDMGHLGKKPIVISWNFVFISLLVNYLGQGAFFIQNYSKITEYNSLIFLMSKDSFPYLYIPAVILSLLATIIASQAMISAMFSIFYQTSNLSLLPRLKYIHTSSKIQHQIYIPFINYLFLVLVIFTILFFKSSEHIANAYGLSVNITIVISCIMAIIAYIYFKKPLIVLILSLVLLPFNLIILVSNIHKLKEGGYFPFFVAIIIFLIVIIYTNGNKKLGKALVYEKFDNFIQNYESIYLNQNKIKGTAVFMLKDINMISPYIIKTIFDFKILYEKTTFLSIEITNNPYDFEYNYIPIKEDKTNSLGFIKVKVGYLKILDLNEIFKSLNLEPTVLFYGQENIITNKLFIKIYSFIRKISPTIVDFYNFPLPKTIGIVSNIYI